MMTFTLTREPIKNRGRAPVAFLAELVRWAQEADSEIFAPNDNPHDIYTSIKRVLGTQDVATGKYSWDGPLHRIAAMCEVMRVHAGLESSWQWNASVDTTNASSQAHKEREETGIFQVSYDSLNLDKDGSLDACIFAHSVARRPQSFIDAMKANHSLALEYYARLVRLNVAWAGPIVRGEKWLAGQRPQHDNLHENLSTAAMQEFEALLKQVA